jgi:hypothetical protein
VTPTAHLAARRAPGQGQLVDEHLSNLSVFSFMTPRFGVSAGGLVPRERADPSFVMGAVLVLTGLLVVSAPGVPRLSRPLKTGALSPKGL